LFKSVLPRIKCSTTFKLFPKYLSSAQGYTKMKVFLNLILILLCPTAFASANLHHEMACYEALIGYSDGSNYLVNGDIIILPIEKEGVHGFYAFTSEHANYYQLSNKPTVNKNTSGDNPKDFEQRFEDFYYFVLDMPEKNPLYFVYNIREKNESHPDLIDFDYTLAARPKLAEIEQTLSGGSLLDESSRGAFHHELKKRIGAVFDSFQSMEEFYSLAYPGQKIPLSAHSEYLEALEVCSEVEEVKEAVRSELKKFPTSQAETDEEVSGSHED
jgi:hypothetical protein